MDAKISQAQEKYSLLDSVPLGMCIIQSDQIVLFWNSCLEQWTKIPRSKILGSSITEHFPHFNQPLYADRLHQIFQGGPPTIFSSQLHKYIIPSPSPHGSYRIQHTTVTSVPAFDGVGFYALFSIQDVTDLTFWVKEYRSMRDQALVQAEECRQAQEIAEAANRVKDEFLAVLSHELRSPLNPILGWTKLLQKGRYDQAQQKQALETIERNAKLQIKLIDDLLDVAKILRGKLPLKPVPVNLLAIIEAALETVQAAAIAKSIVIEKVLLNPVQVAGDGDRLQQVLWNLLSNAIKFTPNGGRVKIQLEQVGNEAQITVSDTGKGISGEFQPYVFDYFRQADASVTRMHGGLGLGLAIVRHLVELHGGRVSVFSPGENQGATFTVLLPILQPQPVLVNEDDTLDAEPDLTGVRILVVDDDPDTRDLLTFLLEDYGAGVMVVASAGEAFRAFESFKPDVLVSDIGMPIEDGYSFLRQIRSLPPEQGGQVPAIALTAYAKQEDQQQALVAGFQQHLSKPVEPQALVTVIARLIKLKTVTLKAMNS
ncbi:ATP-binding protein [Aetokthonos hydrillicola Thurmond2011]|uniref:histidine kinase n=2 Tax=Aetokthonos TaxID=1550243 RepID=A0AAP5M8S3_9CYAN|nr:ATP-binding protein [Aetokthonos hydrillicola]MBO3459341.1 response regulator [Aetokthonos hydrillicola CCALA 1050]MBW4586487.1 response regulator [Aetokthonos hydrillicola CCALA 1050]MDR9893569.1 ATP-binding protein [Aetokthonos hydrillicola Thurmond2011]